MTSVVAAAVPLAMVLTSVGPAAQRWAARSPAARSVSAPTPSRPPQVCPPGEFEVVGVLTPRASSGSVTGTTVSGQCRSRDR